MVENKVLRPMSESKRERSSLRHYATCLKVVDSNPDWVIEFFNFRNPFSRTIALGLIPPLTEISTRNLPAG
jgi:hypothetical protein